MLVSAASRVARRFLQPLTAARDSIAACSAQLVGGGQRATRKGVASPVRTGVAGRETLPTLQCTAQR